MTTRTPLAVLCVLGLILSSTAPAGAVWRFTRVDNALRPYCDFKQGEFVYGKNDDVKHYRISTNQTTAVTGNGPLALETPLAVQDGRVWYVSHFPGPSPQYRLLWVQVGTGQHELLHTTGQEISPYEAAWDAYRLVVRMAGDWWLWDSTGMQQITFSGSALCKKAPSLEGNHLVWLGDEEVYHTYLPTRETRAVGSGKVENASLRACSTHAAWVEAASPGGESGYRIRLMHLGSLEPVTVDTSMKTTWVQVRFQPPYLFYAKDGGDEWSIVRMHPYIQNPQPIYTSDLPLDNPWVHGTDLFFLVMNCVSRECMELYKHDLTSGETVRLTSYGRGSLVVSYQPDGDRVAFVRLNLFNPDQPVELYAGQDEPGAVCGTALPHCPGDLPLNLILLLLPLCTVGLMRPRPPSNPTGPAVGTASDTP